ncbi:DUF3068 domain-containing protein [Thermomonospora catenispora]|mgnify:CR=1 FL=1|uniref:DUF3068 domain-containing protein n=1 Tax=Thermomonospora catenispora TaxID=2493090 RepID=UPI00111E7793|nr:DUF3068 domain-containing protein [Thermomonospora catenispora]TNY36472.1 DUF3068 domain-containing protein [Thermomonospora catenispora]
MTTDQAPRTAGRNPSDGETRSRGLLAPILLGVGVFLLTTALALRFFVADRLLVAPTNLYQKTTLQAIGASYFDAGAVQDRTGATLTLTSTMRGDVKAAKGDTAVWDVFQVLEDIPNGGNEVSIIQQRLAFDRGSGELKACCGTHVNNDTSVRPSGLSGLFWPVGSLEKKTYQVFDASTKRSWPAEYQGTETIRGVKAYKFVQTIPDTVIATLPEVPSTLLGIPGKSRNVAADRYQRATIAYWVDPRSGVTVHREQQVVQTLRGKDGNGSKIVADFTLKMTPQSQKELVAKADDTASKVSLLRVTGPLVSLLLGLALLGAGAAAMLRRRGTRHAS